MEDTLTEINDVFSKEDSKLPDANDMHEHISKVLKGKLGMLAKDIADKVVKDFEMDIDNPESVNDVFQTLIKNPNKLMKLVKSVGNELDERLKSGDIKESELMEEANDIVKNMKNMPGMNNIQNMLKKLGLDGSNIDIADIAKKMGIHKKNVNVGATKSRLNNMSRMEKQKELMKEKIRAKKLEMELAVAEELKKNDPEYIKKKQIECEKAEKAANKILYSEGFEDGKEKLVFRTGEKYEKSSANGLNNVVNKKNKKKKK